MHGNASNHPAGGPRPALPSGPYRHGPTQRKRSRADVCQPVCSGPAVDCHPIHCLCFTSAGDIEGKLSEFLLQFLLPESSTQVVQYLSTFIEHARSLTVFGVAILFVTAILMLRNVKKR